MWVRKRSGACGAERPPVARNGRSWRKMAVRGAKRPSVAEPADLPSRSHQATDAAIGEVLTRSNVRVLRLAKVGLLGK